MGEALLAGSALAAFVAGLVAFFAPCCSLVMLPSYLASVAGARRWRMVALTLVFVAGVGTVVWPLTIGAAGLASLLTNNHAELFVVGGSLMLVVGWATLRGWMWNAPTLGGTDRGGLLGLYSMGVVSGAATACCAPVLAGAVTVAGLSGSLWAGTLLGGVYLLGMVTPLIAAGPTAARLLERLRDRQVVLRGFGRRLSTTWPRLVSAGMFLAVGVWMLVLALTGQAESAPAAQRALGRWLSEAGTWVVERVPTGAGWALVAALIAGLTVLTLRGLRRPVAAPSTPSSSGADDHV